MKHPIFQRIQHELNYFLEKDFLNTFVKPSTESKSTVVMPFKLNDPKPRALLLPVDAKPKISSIPIPASNYQQPDDFAKLDETKVQNKLKSEQLLLESEALKPLCAQKNNYKGHKCSVPPKQQNYKRPKRQEPAHLRIQPPEVNVNAATLLRESKLYEKKEQEIIKAYVDLETGAFNDVAYQRWREHWLEQQAADRKRNAEKCKLMSGLAYENAIAARERNQRQNRARVEKLMAEKQVLAQRRQRQQLHEQYKIEQQVADIIKSHEGAILAQKRVEQEKKQMADKVSRETKYLQKQKEKNELFERKRKQALIAEIRATEAALCMKQANGPRLVNLAEMPKHGLLCEMSIIELRERLLDLKAQQERQLADKRNRVVAEKADKQLVLQEAIEKISRHRAAKTVAAAKAIYEAGRPPANESQAVIQSNAELSALSHKLAEKRQKRQEKRGLSVQDPTASTTSFNTVTTAVRNQAFHHNLAEKFGVEA